VSYILDQAARVSRGPSTRELRDLRGRDGNHIRVRHDDQLGKMTDVIHGIPQPGPRHIHTKPDMPITSSNAQRRSPYMRALSPQTQDCARGGGDGHEIRRWLLIAYRRLTRDIE
jgi:hypothetical protein